MNLKASFFSKSIFKSDMKRFWWIGLLETFILIVAVVIPLYERCTRFMYNFDSYGKCVPEWMNGSFLLIILFSLCVSVVLLSYMHFSASVCGHHSIPVTRKKLLSTKLISAVLLTVLPIIINGIIIGAILFRYDFYEFYGFADIIKWIIAGVLYCFLIISLTAFVNMMTGNPIGSLVFTTGFIFLPAILIISFSAFLEQEVFGYTSNNVDELLKFIYIGEKSLITAPYIFVYLLLTVLFTLGAYKLYGKRKLESHGEVITFKWLVPVFIGIISIFSSIASYVYFVGILGKDSILYILPLGAVGTVIAWMVSRKSLSLKGVVKPVGIYLVAGLVFCSIFYFDLTGYERRIPDIDDVESVILVSNKQDYVVENETKIHYVEEGKIDLALKDKEYISNVISLHKYLVDNRKSRFDNGYYTYLPIEYSLKNGKQLRRAYRVNHVSDAAMLKPIYETEQMKANTFKLVDGSKKEYMRVSIRDRRVEESFELYPDNKNFQLIINAMMKDMQELRYEEFMISGGGSISIDVIFKTNKIYERPFVEAYSQEQYEHYSISSAYKNTMQVLEQMGFYIPKATDIEGITIATWDGEAYYSDKDKGDQKITSTTNPEEIAAIYAVYDSMIEGKKYTRYEDCKNIKVSYRLKTGKTFEVSCSYDEDKIPETLKKYF